MDLYLGFGGCFVMIMIMCMFLPACRLFKRGHRGPGAGDCKLSCRYQHTKLRSSERATRIPNHKLSSQLLILGS